MLNHPRQSDHWRPTMIEEQAKVLEIVGTAVLELVDAFRLHDEQWWQKVFNEHMDRERRHYQREMENSDA